VTHNGPGSSDAATCKAAAAGAMLPSDSTKVVAFRSRRGPYAGVRALVMPIVGLTIAVSLAAACSNGADGSASSTTSRSTATTEETTSTTTVESAVLDGYRSFWVAYLAAADPMNPQHPDLEATATGAQLEQVRSAFLFRLSNGEVIRGEIETHPRIEGDVQSTTATVHDCSTDNSHIFDAKTGAQKDDPETVTHEMRADMVFVDGTWKVEAVHHLRDGCTPA
jgi:hypothetical protein